MKAFQRKWNTLYEYQYEASNEIDKQTITTSVNSTFTHEQNEHTFISIRLKEPYLLGFCMSQSHQKISSFNRKDVNLSNFGDYFSKKKERFKRKGFFRFSGGNEVKQPIHRQDRIRPIIRNLIRYNKASGNACCFSKRFLKFTFLSGHPV